MSGESAGLSLPDSFLCTGGKNTQFRCSYCELDLSGGKLRFRCAECENFELCQDCFASGAKLYPHEPTHKYLVSDCLDASIFGKDWSIGEELLLLEGVERFGPGNWKVISEYIGTKSAAACDHHYWETYMGIFGRCLPSKTVLASGEDVSTDDILTGRASGASGAASSSSNGVGSNDAIIDDDKKSDLITKTKDSDKTASTLDVSTAPPLNSSSNSRSNKSSGSSSYGSSSSSGSYCADSTSSSGAGGGLSGDKPRIDDTIDIHVPNVSRGEKVVRSERVGAGTSKDKSKDTADVRQKLGAMVGADLPGFMPLREDFEVEWDNEAENILKYMDFDPADHPSERELKLQVLRIYNNRLRGREEKKRFAIDRGLVDIKRLQHQERRRTKEERDFVARMQVFERFQGKEEHDALVEGLLKANQLKRQIKLIQHYRAMGCRTMEQARQYEIAKKRRDEEIKAQKLREDTPYLFQSGRNRGLASTSRKQRSLRDENSSQTGSSSGGGANANSKSTGDGLALTEAEISLSPGCELLAPAERMLCRAVPMLPLHYLAAKDAVTRECYRNGMLSKEGVRRVVRLESMPGNAQLLCDFFVHAMNVAPARQHLDASGPEKYFRADHPFLASLGDDQASQKERKVVPTDARFTPNPAEKRGRKGAQPTLPSISTNGDDNDHNNNNKKTGSGGSNANGDPVDAAAVEAGGETEEICGQKRGGMPAGEEDAAGADGATTPDGSSGAKKRGRPRLR